MIFSARIGTKLLAQMSRRFGSSLQAGLDIRRITEREATVGSMSHRRHMAAVHKAVKKGDTLTSALKSQNNYFPSQFCQMVAVGEKTGRLELVLTKMAEYYEQLHRLKGMFLMGILWPGLQFLAAIGVVGLLIWIMGWISSSPRDQVDLLGFGLVGNRGLVIYLLIVNSIALAVFILISLVRRGFLLPRITELIMRLPAVGPAMRLMAQLRFTRTLGLAIDAGFDAISWRGETCF